MFVFFNFSRRSSGEYIASLQRDLETLEARNEEVSITVQYVILYMCTALYYSTCDMVHV